MTIAQILMTKGSGVITIRPEEPVRQAVALLARHNIGALVVVDEAGRPVGILSERDVVRAAARDEGVFGRAVAELMTRQVVTGLPGDDLVAVAGTMTERRIRHLPVLDGGRLVGMVSIGDVLRAQRDKYQGEAETLEIRLLAGERVPD
jgi:CBS domain-containing protein